MKSSGEKQKTEAQMESGMNMRATGRDGERKKKRKVREMERWVVDGSSGTLWWRFQSLCVCCR